MGTIMGLLPRHRLVAGLALVALSTTPAGARDYYISSSTGQDSNDGLTAETAMRTIGKVNSLALVAGDAVRFRCGDTWRAEVLRVERSGASGNPITYTSYPDEACADKPVLAGTQPVTGWTVYSGPIWMATLGAGTFPSGTNQLFRDGNRLRLGRWPNVGSGDGYSQIDAQPSTTQLRDDELPAVVWTGATVHIKAMRWYILNRTDTADSTNTLTLNTAAGCWGGSCAGWGWFLNGHLATLDQEGEWYYDPATRRVYLFTSTDPSTSTIEGSVVMTGESEYMGGIILGRHLNEHIAYVTIDNLEIRGWYDNGVTTPVNLHTNEHSYVTLRNLTIRDVDGAGINLATWVYDSAGAGNGYNGWRGGHHMTIEDCLIERANEYGINSYARSSTFQRNTLRDIARIENVGRAGIGCSLTDGEGACTEPGAGIRLKVDQDGTYSSSNVTLQGNRLEGIGHNGFDVFSYGSTITRNVIRNACATKGDCGAMRLFGRSPLGSSPVHDSTIQDNLILDITGNTDGCHTSFRSLFGFGLYVDSYSRNITSTGNTVARATAAGILYQDSTGTITGNVLFGNAAGTGWTHQTVVTRGGSGAIAAHTNNVMVGFQSTAGTLGVEAASQLATSNLNGFYHSSRSAHIDDAAGSKTLAQWRSASGKDAGSRERVAAAIGEAQLFTNDQDATLTMDGQGYVDLDGNAAPATIEIPPFKSVALIGSPLRLVIQDAQVTEGDDGTHTISFTVTLTSP
jgi:hypothetical protein